MNLRYISIHIKNEIGGFKYSSDFGYNTRFIDHYLSIAIRKIKFKTDGTFNMLCIEGSNDCEYTVCRIMGEDALCTDVLFDKPAYEQMGELEKYEYYLHLLEEGYKICAKHKNIPLEHLLKLHQDFRNNGYKNEWQHKKKKFKELGIEVALDCYFTSFDFKLIMTVNDVKSKKELVSGIVMRTFPNEIHFARDFRDIIIDSEYLIITNFLNDCRFRFLISDILQGIFKIEEFDYDINKKEYMLIDRENDSRKWVLPI